MKNKGIRLWIDSFAAKVNAIKLPLSRVSTLTGQGRASVNPAANRSLPALSGDVYVTGYEKNGSKYVTKVWKNGVATSLTDGTNNVIVCSVYVSGNDVYAAGSEHNGSLTEDTYSNAYSVFVTGSDVYKAGYERNGSRNVAKVWKNGVVTNLTDGTSYAQARSVYVSGSDVYVAGYERNGNKDVAKVWKNGTVTHLTDGTNNACAYSVFVK